MVNNSTNINKTNSHFSPSLTEHKKDTKYDVGILGPVLQGQKQRCGRVKHVKKITTWWIIYLISVSKYLLLWTIAIALHGDALYTIYTENEYK